MPANPSWRQKLLLNIASRQKLKIKNSVSSGFSTFALEFMQHRIAILLALVLFAQSMAPLLGQLAKIPALVAHFYAHHEHEHHSHGLELNFFDFLSEHYGGRSHHDDASQGHSNLPFCGIDNSLTVMFFAPPAGFPLAGITIASFFWPKADFGNAAFHSSLFGQGVFRPPLA